MKTRGLVQVLDVEEALQIKVVAQGILILTRSQIQFWSHMKDDDRDLFKQASQVDLPSFDGAAEFTHFCVTEILPHRVYGLILTISTHVMSFVFDNKFQFQKGFEFSVEDTTIQCLQIHSPSRLLVIGTEDQELRFYDFLGHIQRRIPLPSRPQSLVCQNKKRNENRFIVSCYDGSLISFQFHEKTRRLNKVEKSRQIIKNGSSVPTLGSQSAESQGGNESSKTSGSLEVIDEGIRRAVMAFHLGVAI
jgi:hypothetical protein